MSVQQLGNIAHFIAAVGDRLDGTPFALMLDIDGTLAPIAPTPAEAKVPAETRDLLRRLATLPRVAVVLVSGRSAEDSWRLAGTDGAWIIGNHGIETRAPDGTVSVDEAVRSYERAIAQASGLLSELERTTPGALVENKRWTMSLHYRLVEPDRVPPLVERARQVAYDLGLRTFDGRKIVELRPPVRVDKGTASVAFAEHHGAFAGEASVLYAGDDRTDEDAFRELRARSERPVTVRILSSEDQTSVATLAEFVMQGPNELRQLLSWCVSRRERASSSG